MLNILAPTLTVARPDQQTGAEQLAEQLAAAEKQRAVAEERRQVQKADDIFFFFARADQLGEERTDMMCICKAAEAADHVAAMASVERQQRCVFLH